ncbi:YihY/virulence factor BrkB family protein [Lacticaseibacillus jixianensis]|uniref:YihY/virulence factor BrkB family protein n=1 Tax=Lacticaseibacillus jixianensis TaxID=2486012 RepID=A0ABW4B8N6_9LACO|nr:YihY/virulence factor BrkB family protein [Lacticaseibacillus jixianensis]
MERQAKQKKRLTEAQKQAIHSGQVPLATIAVSRGIKLREAIKLMYDRIMDAQIGVMSAALAYYTLLSLFPIFIVVGNLLPVFGFSYSQIQGYLTQVIPTGVMNFINPIIRNLIASSSGSVLSVAGLVTLWTAGLAVNGLKTGFNRAYDVKPRQNYFVQRLLSMVIIFFMILMLGGVMVAYTFGRQFLEWLVPLLRLSTQWLDTFNTWRWPVTLTALFLVIFVIDFLLPNARIKFWTIIPGGTFTVVSWLALGQIFSWYMRRFGTRISTYGTLSTVIALLLWLDLMAMLWLIGVVVNAIIAEYYGGRPEDSKGKVHDLIRRNRQELAARRQDQIFK